MSYKKFSTDRKEFSRSEAFAKTVVNRMDSIDILGQADENDLKMKFKHHELTNHFHSVVASTTTKVVDGAITKYNPNDPPQNIVDSSYVNIGKNSNSKYIGKAPVKTGAVPWNAKRNSVREMRAYWSGYIPEDYIKDGLYNTFVLSGGWKATQFLLREFSTHKYLIPKSYNRQRRYIDNFTRRYNNTFPIFPKVQTSELCLQKIRKPSRPGGDWDNIFSNKEGAINTAIVAARWLMIAVYEKALPNLSYYTCGGRAKGQANKAYGSVLRSRLTWQQDFVEFLIAKPYVDKIERFFFSDKFGPIKIGKNITMNRHSLLIGDFLIYKWGVCADFSLFDSSLVRDKIVAAFAICRSFFEVSDQIDNIFIYMCDGFINKYVLAPDGKMFKIGGGAPSGNAWTTIINSIANSLIMEELLLSYGPFTNKDSSYIVAGDDTALLFMEEINFSNEKLISFIKRKFDMNLEVTKKGICINRNPNLSLDFNKICFYWSGNAAVPTTCPDLLFKKLCVLEHDRGSLYDNFNKIEGQASRLLTHPDAIKILACFQASILHSPATESFNAAFVSFSTYIRYLVDKVYFSSTNLPLSELTNYAGDKEFIINLLNGGSVNEFAWNWLYDNTAYYNTLKIAKNSRKRWFELQVGVRSYISLLFMKAWSKTIGFRSRYGIEPSKVIAVIQNGVDWGDLRTSL